MYRLMRASSVKLHEMAAVLSILHCMSSRVHSLLLTTIEKHFSRSSMSDQLAYSLLTLHVGEVIWIRHSELPDINLFIRFFQVL